MCFSPTASFVAAALTGTIGLLSLRQAKTPNELPLAAMPLLFAAQQAIEGLLWLDLLSSPEPNSSPLILLFLLFAKVLWPVYVPIAGILVEPNAARRKIMAFCIAIGVVVSIYLLIPILTQPRGVELIDNHVVYLTEKIYTAPIVLAYVAATSLSLLLSSHRIVVALGAMILVGSAAAFIFYWAAFVSVFCFFAAGASVLVLCHFIWSRPGGKALSVS